MASGRAWEQAESAPGMVYPSGHTMMGAGRYGGRASGARSGRELADPTGPDGDWPTREVPFPHDCIDCALDSHAPSTALRRKRLTCKRSPVRVQRRPPTTLSTLNLSA